MEQFVLGIFQEQLAKFIVGFRKEQVNANLLNGKGEINNVELNCAFLNETISKVSPFIELKHVHVSKLSFHVSSWTNLRKAPIMIDIEHVRAVVAEPLDFVQKTQRKPIRQITKNELIALIQAGLQPTRPSYNIFDRILDNLTIEIVSVHMEFQPWGKFKTRRPGPWTPPAIEVDLAGIRVYSVNEYGQEAPPEEVWRHNHRNHGALMIYKKLEMEYQISIRPVGKEAIPLVSGRDNKMEVHVAMQRRVRDGEWLSVQVDAIVPKLEVDIPADVVPHLAHVLAGVTYTLSKDRGFVDPLKPQGTDAEEDVGEVEVKMNTSESAEMDEVNENAGDADVPVDLDGDDSSSSSEGEGGDLDGDAEKASISDTKQSPGSQATARPLSSKNLQDHPVIVLPNGLVIHNKLTFSLSVHDTVVRGTYAPKCDGSIELVAKGSIVEMIWPKIMREKGGYAQASVSYVSVQERYGRRLRTLLVGGVQFDSSGPVERPGQPLRQVSRDESFPLFEDRSVRPDPLGLRHSFPAQAFGLKTTVDFVKKLTDKPDSWEEEIQVQHEVGIDMFDIVLDSHAWCRAIRFALNEDGGGFDARWHTGGWTNSLKPDMLANPKASPLNLDGCLQPTKQLFLDENDFISSDLFNVTSRATNVNIRIPAPIHEDARSCDIIVQIDESMLVVSSALPRTFLSGKIGSSIYGDDAESKGIIDFPNDPSDIAYVLENTEDPSSRQRGVMTSKAMSTFRLQLTVRDFSIRIVPVIPLCAAKEPHQLLAPSEMTMIVCFEGEPPESTESNLTRMALFVSFLAHRFEVNLDFDLAASAVSTLLHHADVIEATLADCIELFESNEEPPSYIEPSESSVGGNSVSSSDLRIKKSMRGRKVLVRKQILLSRETGGISLAFCLQLAEFRLNLWRQNVPHTSPLRASTQDTNATENHGLGENYVPLVQLMEFEVKDLEFAVEGSFHRDTRRVIVKGCLSEVCLKGCQLDLVLQNAAASTSAGSPPDSGSHEEGDTFSAQATELLEIFSLGGKAIVVDQDEEASDQIADYGMAFRFEERLDNEGRSWSVASDIARQGIASCRVRVIETLVVLTLEALLMPTWSKSKLLETESGAGIFPPRTVGALLTALVPADILSLDSHIGPLPTGEDPVLELVGQVPGKGVDRMLRDLITKLLPDDVSLLLVRIHLNNFLVNVPTRLSAVDLDSFSGFGLLLHQSDFSASYFASPDSARSDLLGMLARKGEIWSAVVESREEGLRHRLVSRQSLNRVVPGTGGLLIKEALVPAFEAGYTYSESKAFLSLNNGLAIENLDMLDEFVLCLSRFANRCKNTAVTISGTLTTLRSSSRADVETDGTVDGDTRLHPVGVACSRSATAIRSVRDLLRRVSERVAIRDQSLQELLAKREKEVENLRLTVFSKERERIGALALTSSQVMGWLRIGATQKTGLRGSMTCMLWPHWCVVRRSLLILYSGPGTLKPVDIVSLSGATLHQLGGGRRKRDLKRAFAIVDRTGLAHLVIAGSDAEYFNWARELQKAIDLFSGATVTRPVVPSDEVPSDEPGAPTGLVSHSLQDAPVHGETGLGANESNHSAIDSGVQPPDPANSPEGSPSRAATAIGQDVSLPNREPTRELLDSNSAHVPSVAHAATSSENTSVEVPAASIDVSSVHTTEDPGEMGLDAGDQSEGTTKRRQLRSKFAGVGQVTKSRFGSALQAAKEKGRQVAEKRRHRTLHDENEVLGGPVATLSPHTVDTNGRQVPNSDREEDTVVSTTWSCVSCTFLNPAVEATCQMCGGLQVPVSEQEGDNTVTTADDESQGKTDQVDDTHENVTDQDDAIDDVGVADETDDIVSDFAEEVDSEAQSPRRGMRGRLGAAVQSVRRGKDQDGGVPRNTNRFSLRRRGTSAQQETANGVYRTPDAIRLRNVVVTGPLGSPTHPFGDASGSSYDIPLKKLKGAWFVLVTNTEDREPKTSEEGSKDATIVPSNPVASTHQSEDMASGTLAVPLEPASSGATTAPPTPSAIETVDSDPASQTQMTSQPVLPEPKGQNVFRIQVFKRGEGLIQTSPVAEADKTFPEILALHTALSESIAHLPLSISHDESNSGRLPGEGMSDSLAGVLGLSTLDTVRITGRLLGGLLQDPTSHVRSDEASKYHAEVVAEFFNSVLDCPLPIDGLATLADFLRIVDVSTENTGTLSTGTEMQELGSTSSSTETSRERLISVLFAPSALCEAELLRAEQKSLFAERLANATVSSPPPQSSIDVPPSAIHNHALPPSTTARFQEAMHSALMKVMEERDEAHSKMVAAKVIHAHQVKQEQKKANHLATQLELAVKKAASSNTGRLRMAAAPDTKDQEQLRKYERAMQQNSDEELVSLCQQLAGEISARTSASLEVIRLKESRDIERDQETSEKQALQQELIRVKELLAREKSKAEQGQRESKTWKKSYEEIIDENEA